MYLDRNGNIVQSNMDGGDTAQRTGFLESALRIRDLLGIGCSNIKEKIKPWDFQTQWPTLMDRGQLIRNPINWNDPKDTSRDQTTPMIIAFGLNRMDIQIKSIMPRGFMLNKYQNADIASPDNMAVIDRALGIKPSWLGDYWAYWGIKLRCSQAAKNPDDVGDDLNCLIESVYSSLVFPTAQSTKNLKFYLNNRPINFGVSKLGHIDPVVGALYWYFRADAGGNPELAEAWEPIIYTLRERLK